MKFIQSTLKEYSYIMSSSQAASMDLPDPLLPPISIAHRSREVFQAISCIGTELLYIGFSWLSYLCSSMWSSPLRHIAYECVLISPAVSRMSSSSNFDSFRDGWLVAVRLLFCRVLPPRLDQYRSQHSCVTVVKLFLHTFS